MFFSYGEPCGSATYYGYSLAALYIGPVCITVQKVWTAFYIISTRQGIDPERGSFLTVQIKRGGEIRKEISLYDFLPRVALDSTGDGDVIFVAPREHTVRVVGLVENAKRFEFLGREIRFQI